MKIKELYWLMRNLYKFMIIYAKIKESYWLMLNLCKFMLENQRSLLVYAHFMQVYAKNQRILLVNA